MISGYCGQKLTWKAEAREIPLSPWWGVENGILLFLINEGLNWKCFHGNKIFYILVLLLSRLMSTKFHMILTSNVWITWDLNINKYKSYLWRNNFC